MTAPTTTKLQVNYKMGDVLINVYAIDALDFNNQLIALSESIALIKSVGQQLNGQPSPADLIQQQLGGTMINATPTTYQGEATPAEGHCKHGPLKWLEGQGPKGPWKGWFCPAPKGTPDQCKPKFVR